MIVMQGGNTALHLAARGGHVSAALLLLQAGADPTALNKVCPKCSQA
jgi:ankyrin repeat protein